MFGISKLYLALAAAGVLVAAVATVYLSGRSAGVNSERLKTETQRRETRNANDRTIKEALDAGRSVPHLDRSEGLPDDDPFRRSDGE